MKRRLTWVIIMIGCVGCATTAPVVDLNPPVPPEPPVAVEAPQTLPDIKELIASEPIIEASATESLQAINWANARAIIRPRRQYFEGAIVTYPYMTGRVYAVDAGKRLGTDLIFPTQEKVLKVTGGDDWWDVEVLYLKDAVPPEYRVVLTPKDAKLKTRFIVRTTARAYYLWAQSHEQTSVTAIQWNVPQPKLKRALAFGPGVYHTGYDTKVTDGRPVWTPIGVWDTGAGGKTLIQFPPAKRTHTAPVLYGIGPDGEPQLVNYRVVGDWYVVDRLLEQAELRVGHKKKQSLVVRIQPNTSYRAIRCPVSPECPVGVQE